MSQRGMKHIMRDLRAFEKGEGLIKTRRGGCRFFALLYVCVWEYLRPSTSDDVQLRDVARGLVQNVWILE